MALLAIIALGLALRLYRIDEESVCLEEYVVISHMEAPSLLAFVTEVKSHYPYGAPLAFVIEYLWTCAIGYSVARVRLVCVLAGMLVIPLIYCFARHVYGGGAFGRRAGLLAALCVALSPVHIFHSQEARMYAFFALFALLASFTFLKAVREDSKRWLALNALANVCVMWTHLFGVLVLFSEGLFLLVFGWRRMRRSVAWFAVHFALTIPLGLWILSIPRQPDRLYSYYYAVTPRFLFCDLFGDDAVWMAGLASSANTWDLLARCYYPFNVAMSAVLCASVLWLVWRLTRAKGVQRENAAYLLMWFAAPVLALGVISHFVTPCYTQRFTSHCSLALYVIAGGAVASLPRRWPWYCAFGAFAVLYGYQTALVQPGPIRTDWRALVDAIESQGTPDDLVLIKDEFWLPMFEFSAGHLPNPVSTAHTDDVLLDAARFYIEHSGQRGFWLIAVMDSDRIEGLLRADRLIVTSREFAGERRPILYRSERRQPVPARETADDGAFPRAEVLAEAIARQRDHPSLVSYRKRVQSTRGGGCAFARLAIAFAEKGHIHLAATAMAEAVRVEPKRALEFADLDEALGGEANRGGALDAALASHEAGPEALLELLSALDVYEDTERVLEVARRAVARCDRDGPLAAGAYTYLGRGLEQTGNNREAMDAYRKAIELSPDADVPAYIGLGTLLLREGRAVEACDVLRRGTEQYPNAAWMHAHLGTALAKTGDRAAAIAALGKAAGIAPGETNIRALLDGLRASP